MLDELIQERLKKLSRLKDAGIDPYPSRTERTHTAAEARKKFKVLASSKKKISLVGRAVGWRDQGNLIFVDLSDETGKFQLVLKKDNLGNFDLLKETLERGDFLCAGGFLFTTKKGEESLEAKEVQILSKSIRPLPSSWYGLEETETRFRKSVP